MRGGDGKQTCRIWDLVGGPGQGQPPVPVRDWSAAFSLLGNPYKDNLNPRIWRQVVRLPLVITAVPAATPRHVIAWVSLTRTRLGGSGPQLNGSAR